MLAFERGSGSGGPSCHASKFPTGTAWQALFNDQGTLEKWEKVARLSVPVTDAVLVSTGSNLWLWGGMPANAALAAGVSLIGLYIGRRYVIDGELQLQAM